MLNHRSCVLVGLIVLALSPAPAHAYIDPGTGSVLIQGLIAAIAAIGITLKLYWYRIMRFLGIKKDDKSVESKDDNLNP